MNIGEAASASGVSAKMIRYYEGRGLIPGAARKDSGYRQFNQRDVETLRFIRRARDLGFSLERIGTLLALWGDHSRRSADVKALARQYMGELDRDIANLQSIREQLAQLAEHCHGDGRPDCPILEGLAQPAAASVGAGPA
jgi:MerR family copper efflux transcriptional regulator